MPKLDEATRRGRIAASRTHGDLSEVLSMIIDAREAQGLGGDWLDLVMPNDRPLRDCSFGELNELALLEEARENELALLEEAQEAAREAQADARDRA